MISLASAGPILASAGVTEEGFASRRLVLRVVCNFHDIVVTRETNRTEGFMYIIQYTSVSQINCIFVNMFIFIYIIIIIIIILLYYKVEFNHINIKLG